MKDPEHANFLLALKQTQSKVTSVDAVDLGDRILVLATEQECRFSVYVMDHDENAEQPIVSHLTTKIDGMVELVDCSCAWLPARSTNKHLVFLLAVACFTGGKQMTRFYRLAVSTGSAQSSK